jgi:hypothetical protein
MTINLIPDLLRESKATAKKYVSDKATLELIASKDPSKNFKYTEAMAKFYTLGSELSDIISSINVYYSLDSKNMLKSIDINSFKSLETLDDWLSDNNRLSKSEVDKISRLEGAEKIYEDDNVLVLSPKTYDACKQYGRGTKWCLGSLDTMKYWSRYKNDSIYFILSKILPSTDPFYKIAVTVDQKGVMRYFRAPDKLASNIADIVKLPDYILKLLVPPSDKSI